MFTAGVLMMVTALRWTPSDKQCAAQLSIWSPLLEAVEYEQRDFESGLGLDNSGFTGRPTAEMEAKWEALSQVPGVLIPPDRVPYLNRSVDQGFVPAIPSSPSSGYVGAIEVFHHLHCLNMLRQYIWRDSYPQDIVPSLLKSNSPHVARDHTSHCIDTLRQALMCTSDVTPYLVYKRKGSSATEAPLREDFQASHKCRKFPKLLDWVTKNGVALSLKSVSEHM
ncbi:Cyclochlorotine biosynthesis protein O [Colletotrichum sidae]|uniref:Cyclochlorotine biosynthesis protein O n=1 Tax=Colletotrichum sidae TaxID=1347389 RepID=A0A4R8TL97_9PEZI|nr:Cyclochlorotine biosynthesis protein O [Colletotrichum sidae]